MIRLGGMSSLWALLRRVAGWIVLSIPAMAAAQNCPPQPTGLTPPQLIELAKVAKDRGFLWRIEKEGRVGHLYGSIHFSKQSWMVPGPKTMAALGAAEIVALEIDILDPEIQAQLAEPSRLGIKPLTLPPPLQARMNALARKLCASDADLSKFHPVMQLVVVAGAQARFSGIEVVYGNEIFFAGFARGARKSVVSLETAQSQMRALLEGEPRDVFDAVDRGMALMEKGRARAVTERLVNAWGDSNLGDLQNYTQWCECADTDSDRKALARLNDDRNPGLAAGIDKLLLGGKNVFAAVGALHMVGPKALPTLLQAMGYKVERVAFEP